MNSAQREQLKPVIPDGTLIGLPTCCSSTCSDYAFANCENENGNACSEDDWRAPLGATAFTVGGAGGGRRELDSLEGLGRRELEEMLAFHKSALLSSF